MAPAAPLTAEQLLQLSFPDKRAELVRGVLRVSEPPGYLHGEVVARLALVVGTHVGARRLGAVLAGDPGFILERGPDTVRAPDVGFVRAERVPTPPPHAFAEFAPDLAIEILSPGDRPGEVLEKVADWLKAGTLLVWVVDPIKHSARVYRADGSEAFVAAHDVLDGEDVLPGFACALESILRA
jgi:Uma2 family endonuclease